MAKVQKTLEKVALPIQPTSSSSDFVFSATLKSPTITLESKTMVNQTTNQNYDKRFALVEPCLDPTIKSKFVSH